MRPREQPRHTRREVSRPAMHRKENSAMNPWRHLAEHMVDVELEFREDAAPGWNSKRGSWGRCCAGGSCGPGGRRACELRVSGAAAVRAVAQRASKRKGGRGRLLWNVRRGRDEVGRGRRGRGGAREKGRRPEVSAHAREQGGGGQEERGGRRGNRRGSGARRCLPELGAEGAAAAGAGRGGGGWRRGRHWRRHARAGREAALARSSRACVRGGGGSWGAGVACGGVGIRWA